MKRLGLPVFIFTLLLYACNGSMQNSKGANQVDSVKNASSSHKASSLKTLSIHIEKPHIDTPYSNEPPFYGTRYFNLYGGSGTGQSLKITKNKQAIITSIGHYRSTIEYKGPYKRIIPEVDPNSPGGKDSTRLMLINDSTIAKLDIHGNIDTGCCDFGRPCISSLERE